MQFTDNDAQVLHNLLLWRRDVRHFRRDPIASVVWDRIRGAVDLAPSVGNARPWRFVEIIDPAARAAVADNFSSANAAAADGYESSQRDAYRALKLAGLDQAPIQVAVFCETAPEAGHRLGRQTMPRTLEQSVVMAIHTLWLTARAENIGVGMLSILDPAGIERLCATPASWRFVAYLCIGHPETADDTPLLHQAKWQLNTSTHWSHR